MYRNFIQWNCTSSSGRGEVGSGVGQVFLTFRMSRSAEGSGLKDEGGAAHARRLASNENECTSGPSC